MEAPHSPRSLAQPTLPVIKTPPGGAPCCSALENNKKVPAENPWIHSSFGLLLLLRKGPRLFHTSVYIRVPTKTKAVPSQCQPVKGFWK